MVFPPENPIHEVVVPLLRFAAAEVIPSPDAETDDRHGDTDHGLSQHEGLVIVPIPYVKRDTAD